jgi:hypothetical protein
MTFSAQPVAYGEPLGLLTSPLMDLSVCPPKEETSRAGSPLIERASNLNYNYVKIMTRTKYLQQICILVFFISSQKCPVYTVCIGLYWGGGGKP